MYIYKYIYTCEYNMGIKCIITYCIDEAYTRLAVIWLVKTEIIIIVQP